MKRKIIKSILSVSIILATLLAFSSAAFALPINTNTLANYLYSALGKAQSAPIAYKPIRVLGPEDIGNNTSFFPVDAQIYKDQLYILDKGSSAILIFDYDYKYVGKLDTIRDSVDYSVPEINKYIFKEDGTREEDKNLTRANKYSFKSPEGFFIDSNGTLYVSDTGHRRVVVCDLEGSCKQVYQAIRIDLLGQDFLFEPTKIVVDSAGTLNLLIKGVNRGIVQIDAEGNFSQFFASPGGSTSAVVDWLTKLTMTAEQIQARTTQIAPEYANISMDSKGFIYTVIHDFGETSPLGKYGADGANLIENLKKMTQVGDLEALYATQVSTIIDISVNEENNTFTVLDTMMGRIFTYNAYTGDLLYLGGNPFEKYGANVSPTAIACWGDQVVVTNDYNKSITVYEMTDYAKEITNAVNLHRNGKYDESIVSWNNVLKYNSNFTLAYNSLAEIEVIKGRMAEDDDPEKMQHYEKSLVYYKLGENREGYAESFKELRNESLSKYFLVIFISIVVLIVGVVVLIFVRKYKKARAEERRRVGL